MKIFQLIAFAIGIVMLLVSNIQAEVVKEETSEQQQDESARPVNMQTDKTSPPLKAAVAAAPDDVDFRNLQKIELFTNDQRCNDVGICSGFQYGNDNIIVSFSSKMEIHFTSPSRYEVKQSKDYITLTFVDSQFANFPLQLFYAFKPHELDFRNCSLATLKWDNFLSADMLTILLLSENLLQEIEPSLFSLAENLSFLFLDGNRLRVLHPDSFKGLAQLKFLDLHNNLIEVLPGQIFSHLAALQQINLAENRLQLIETDLFRWNPRLFSIHLQSNDLKEIQDYAFQQQELIKYLDFSHNRQLRVFVLANIRVENLWAKECAISRVNIYGEALHVDLQQNSIKELYFSQPELLETLRLKQNSLEQIASLSLASNLRTLDISHNPQLKTLPDPMQRNALERLDLSNTSLREIPTGLFASSPHLRSLNVSFNRLEEIKPSAFKYVEKLTQFYIHHNNWNCYNLKMLMDVVIKPLRISFTSDVFDANYPGEYINGIQCLYRLESEEEEEEYFVNSVKGQQRNAYKLEPEDENISSDEKQVKHKQEKFDKRPEVEQLRHELKAIVGIYEQKFSLVLNKLNELDRRLKEFERFNRTMWQQVAIVI